MELCRVAIPGVFFMLGKKNRSDPTGPAGDRIFQDPLRNPEDGVEGYRAAEQIPKTLRVRGWIPGAGGVLDPLDMSLMFG